MKTAKDILRTDFLSADRKDTLARVNSKISNEAYSEVLVFDKDELIGVFSPTRASMIIPSKDNMGQMRIETLVKSINPLDEGTGLDELLVKMLGTGYNIIPISSNKKIAGVVHIFDLLEAFKTDFAGMLVSDISLHKPADLMDEDRIGNAIQMLHENFNDTILIRDKEGKPVGTLNNYDLLRNLKLDSYKEDRQIRNGKKSEKESMFGLPISEFIKEKIFKTVNSRDSVDDVIELLRSSNANSLIVEDLSSLIKIEDILKSLSKSKMPKTPAVDFVGLEDLNIDDLTAAAIRLSAGRSLEKIKMIIKQDANLKVHVKRHFASHEGKQHNYSVVLHLEYDGNYLSIENVNDWDLNEAIKKGLNELENRMNRVFRTKGAQARDSAESQNKGKVSTLASA